MLKSPKRAMPLTGVTIVVPDRVAPEGFLPMAIVTPVVKLESGRRSESWTVTSIAGVMMFVAAAVLGCTVN